MHVTIFGTGAAGWITCHSLANLDFIKKVTIVGSDKIPTIGVGESTTLLFADWVKNDLNLSHDEYIKFFIDIDSAIKYGVSYEGWSPKTFLHGFYRANEDYYFNSYLLGNKSKKTNVNDYNSITSTFCYKNHVSFDDYNCPHGWHFDANRLIATLQKLAANNSKIEHKIGTLTEIEYEKGTTIK